MPLHVSAHGAIFRRYINKPYTVELCILYGSRFVRAWAGHVARMGEKRNTYRILVGKPEGKRPLGRSRRRWVDNIKIV
jgi:hypothetical protein